MSKNQDTRSQLCGNCKHFVAGGLCELVKGQIKAKDTCDLHAYGNPQPIDTEVDPKYNKLEVNYKPGFMVETTTGDIAQKAIQMEHDLLSRGIPENEVNRAVIDYFSEPEPPPAISWPGPVTGLDLAGTVNSVIVPDTGTPLTDFTGLPENVEPYPTPNKSSYGIGGDSYQNSPTPDPNSIGSTSHTYDFKNFPAPQSAVWDGLATDVNSQPSMHGEHGFNVAKAIPEWRYDIEDSQMYPLKIPDIILPPSGINPLAEAAKKDPKKDFKKRLAKWAILLGGVVGINSIINNYMDSKKEGPLEVFAKYTAKLDDKTCPDCRKSDGDIFNLLETHNRPVVPSENLGYTTRHPNCRCIWEIKENYTGKQSSLDREEKSEINKIENHITKSADNGTLHKIKKDGTLDKKTTTKNPITELCSCMNVTLPPLHLDLPKVSLSKKILQECSTIGQADPILTRLNAGPAVKKLVETAIILSNSQDPQQRSHAYSFMESAIKELEDEDDHKEREESPMGMHGHEDGLANKTIGEEEEDDEHKEREEEEDFKDRKMHEKHDEEDEHKVHEEELSNHNQGKRTSS